MRLPKPAFAALFVAAPLAFLLSTEGGAQTLPAPPAAPAPVRAATTAVDRELNPAPSAVTPNAPAESEPPADAEKAPASAAATEVLNPAFPGAKPKAPVVHRGRRFGVEDLAPYFPGVDGGVSEVELSFDRGRYQEVRTRLTGDVRLPARYLSALAALRGGMHEAAAQEMTALVDDYPAMRDRALVHAAMANEELSRHALAGALYSQVPEGSKLFVDARLGMARAITKMGDRAAAIESLAPLAALPAPGWGRDVGAEALLLQADLAKEAKDKKAEAAALERLWSAHPFHPLAAQAESRLPSVKSSTAALVGRAEAMIDAHRNAQGLAILEPLLPSLVLPDSLACRAHFAHGKALRKERSHTKAIASLSPVTEKCKDLPDLRARALYVLGSSRSIVDQARGVKTYEELAAQFSTHSFADDALFYAADLYVKTGDLDSAQKTLTQVGERYPNGDFAAEALFKSFWIHKTRGEHDAAFLVLDKIEALFGAADETYEVERARYWRARLLESGGKPLEAEPLFFNLALEHPTTYYGLLARSRLEKLVPERALAVKTDLSPVLTRPGAPWPLFAGPMEKDPHFQAAVELLRMGFPEAVTSELLAVNRSGLPAESVRLLVMVISRTGDQRAAHAVARLALRKDLSGPITSDNRPVWEIAYPNAYRELIEKHCATAGVEPDLLQALMREESALDPKALSWAGALGLTQLMPSTAKAVARKLKVPLRRNDELLEPDLNIRLGSAFLGELLDRWSENRFYAVASYNAGPVAVARWKDGARKVELDEWVEEIPIAETRGYVKRVLRSFNTYQLLYGRGIPVHTASLR